jgi:hypothetical protein
MGDSVPCYLSLRILERGRQEVGAWPAAGGGLDVFLDLLADRIEGEVDPEEKNRLVRLREAATSVGSQVGTALLVQWAKSVTGLL